MRVFVSVASTDAAYGGPAVSVVKLCLAAARRGIETRLWCPDGSALSVGDSADNKRFASLSDALEQALPALGTPDIVHDNGIWWPHNHHIARWARRERIPRIVSVRGMLEPWARGHRRLKKEIAWRIYQKRDLQLASVLHVTSAQEQKNIEAMTLGVPVVNIPNGVDLPDAALAAFAPDSRPGPKRAVFLGRLHPIKGLPMLLQAWYAVHPLDWRLIIAGPDEDNHQLELEREVDRLGIQSLVDFIGPVSGKEKGDLLSRAHLFVLPSHSESFGMAAGEALAHGLPVLTTNAVPWPQLEKLECGWRVDANATALEQGLRIATNCPLETLAEMGRRGRRLIGEEYSWDQVADQFIDLYKKLVHEKAALLS